jgi:hypothetical protein
MTEITEALLLEIKTGIASAIERGDWKSHD